MAWPASKASQAEVETFVDTLCFNLSQDSAEDTLTYFFDDVMDELGKKASPSFVNQALEQVTAATAEYSFETNMIRPLYIFYNDQMLFEASESDFQAYSQSWRADSGTPFAYTLDNVSAINKYKLYPNPDTSGAAPGDWTTGFVANNLSIIFSERRVADIEDYYVLPIAFDILQREFSYPSDRTDLAFASVCSEIAALLYRLAGVA